MAGIGAIVGQALEGLLGPVVGVISELVPDKDKRDELLAKVAEARAMLAVALVEAMQADDGPPAS